MGIPRLARLLIFATLVITVPTLYFLYPHRDTIIQHTQGYLEKGGIDSSHWRDPLPPDVEKYEHEEVRDWEAEQPLPFGQDVLDDSDPITSPDPIDEGPSTPKAIEQDVIDGGVIMPKLVNETAKVELGRAAWKVLHLMTLRYPDEPSTSEREALKSYFHLFARLYPCGECAQEFQALLKEYPPQTSSRKTASFWLCHVHNLVNARLGKPEFDCLTLDATYDCGCGPDGNATSIASVEPTGATVMMPHEEWERNTEPIQDQ